MKLFAWLKRDDVRVPPHRTDIVVKINPETVAELKALMAMDGVNATEVVGPLVAAEFARRRNPA